MKYVVGILFSIWLISCLGVVEKGDEGNKFIELSSIDEDSYDYLVLYKIDTTSSDTSLIWEWEKGEEFDSKIILGEEIGDNERILLMGVKNNVVTYAKSMKFNGGKSNGNAQNENDIIGTEYFFELKISLEPTDQQVNVGDAAQFQINVVGKGQVFYQWYQNGELLDGKTAKLLNIPNVSKSDSGNTYYASVKDTAGNEILSNTARLLVYADEDFPVNWKINVQSDTLGTTNPSGTIILGRDSIEVSATAKEGYYFKEWTVEVGQVFITDPLASTTYIKLSGGDGSIKANFSSNKTPSISFSQPDSNSQFLKGENVSFSILAEDEDGSVENVVVFENGNQLITLSTSPFNFAYKFDEAGPHVIKAIATDDSQGSKSAMLNIEIYAIPEFDSFPQDLDVIKGEPIRFDFSVAPGSYPDVSYTWTYLGSSVDTLSTDSLLEIEDSEYDHEGWYQLIVSNEAGVLKSESLYVSVQDTVKPVITLIGADTIIGVGQAYEDLGATALDDRDGELIPSTESKSLRPTSPGTVLITYTASDSSGNVAEVSRSITVLGWELLGKTALEDLSDYSSFGGIATDWNENVLMMGKDESYFYSNVEESWVKVNLINFDGIPVEGERWTVRLRTSPVDGSIHVSNHNYMDLNTWIYKNGDWEQSISERIYAINGNNNYDYALTPIDGKEVFVYMQDYTLTWYDENGTNNHINNHYIAETGYCAGHVDINESAYVSFQNNNNDILGLVKRDTGWVTLGRPLRSEANENTRLEIHSDSSLIPYFFVHDVGSGDVPLINYWNGSAWVDISQGLPAAFQADFLISESGEVVVAAITTKQGASANSSVEIFKFNGEEWEPFFDVAGEIPNTISAGSYSEIELIKSKNNIYYLACLSPVKISVWKFGNLR